MFTAAALHGEKAQAERSDLVRAFKKGDIQVLVATDVAGLS
jgi:superfamily II DNA/RNA helicase